MHTSQPQIARYLIDEIKRAIPMLHREENAKRRRKPAWVLGSGGNEAADELEKLATEFGSSTDLLPHSLVSRDNTTKKETKACIHLSPPEHSSWPPLASIESK